MRRLRINAANPDERALEEAALVIKHGGVVALPTDTLYGLAVDPFNAEAVAKVSAVKERASVRPLPLIAADLAQIIERIGPLPTQARTLASTFWPGPLTILIAAPAALPASVTGGTGLVGVRVPAHETARALCRICGGPLSATSANVSGMPALADPNDVGSALGGRVDVLLDAGPAPGGPPSTIIDASGAAVRLVRHGAIPWSTIMTRVPGLRMEPPAQ
jgi:L-threonylcarbamoyladenylate synthase